MRLNLNSVIPADEHKQQPETEAHDVAISLAFDLYRLLRFSLKNLTQYVEVVNVSFALERVMFVEVILTTPFTKEKISVRHNRDDIDRNGYDMGQWSPPRIANELKYGIAGALSSHQTNIFLQAGQLHREIEEARAILRS